MWDKIERKNFKPQSFLSKPKKNRLFLVYLVLRRKTRWFRLWMLLHIWRENREPGGTYGCWYSHLYHGRTRYYLFLFLDCFDCFAQSPFLALKWPVRGIG